MNNDIAIIKNILENVGVYCDNFTEKSILKDFLEDSLTFVSFFVEIENEYGIEIPDVYYTSQTIDSNIFNLLTIINKCKGVKNNN